MIVGLALWLLGDFAYSRYVHYRIRKWEQQVPWTSAGYAPDAEEYTLLAEDSAAGTNAHTALLLVHGFSDSPQLFRKMAPDLSGRGYACRAILLPGFGQTVQAYAAAHPSEWIAKIDREVNELRQQYTQVWIVAHSLGGAISIRYAQQHPEGLSGMILLAPAIAVSDARSPLFSTRFWHEFSKYCLPFSRISCTPFHMDALDPAEQEREHRNVFTPRSIVEHTFQLIDANRQTASKIRVPTLVVSATRDQVVDNAAMENFYGQLKGTSKKLLRLDNCGHMIPVDLQWKEVCQEIDEFIDSFGKADY